MLERNFPWPHKIQLQDPYSLESPALCGDDTVLDVPVLFLTARRVSPGIPLWLTALLLLWDVPGARCRVMAFPVASHGVTLAASQPGASFPSSAMVMHVLPIASSCAEIPNY